jgi:hypothetical protein
MKSSGDISVNFTTLCGYWNWLQVHVTKFVLKPVLEPCFLHCLFFSEVHKFALQTANWRCSVTDFVRKSMDNYVRHSKMYTGISGPQSSNTDLTNITDIFEQTIVWYVVHKMWMGQNTRHRNSKLLWTIFLSSGLKGKWVAAHDNKKEILYWHFSCWLV